MSTLQIALMLTVLALLLAWLWLRRRNDANGERDPGDRLDTVTGWPPKATRLLNTRELLAYTTLVEGLPEFMVFVQVPLSRFINVPKRNSYADWLRRIGHQCVDFVVCDGAAQVTAVVELQAAQFNDRSHKRLERMTRTLEAANIPLHVWREDKLPSAGDVRRAIAPALSGSQTAASVPGTASRVVAVEPVLGPNPFDALELEASTDELVEFAEPRASTWFDEFDSKPAPLAKR
jgi:hypothetical protein